MNNNKNQNNSQNNTQIAKEEAGKNTAHVAGKAAANYFGGPVGGMAYNALSKTKAGQRLEKNVGKAIAKTPGLGNLNKKLNDTGAVDAANKATDLLSKNPSGKASSGLSNSNTPKALSPESRNSRQNSLYNQRKQNKPKENKKNDNSLENEDNKEEQEDNEGVNEFGETKDIFSFGFSKYKKKILLTLVIIASVLGIILLVAVAVGAFGSLDDVTSPIVSLNSDEDETANHYYDSDNPDLLQEEINFNNEIMGSSDGSISGIVVDYQNEYGVALDTYVLDATLLYRYIAYYQLQIDNMTEEEYSSLLESNPGFNSQIYDFGEASEYIMTVADLMISSTGDSYYSDVSKNGEYYTKLSQSSFFTSYYASVLAYDEYSDSSKLIDEIYEYAEYLREAMEGEKKSSHIISDSMNVHLQTCAQPYKLKTVNNVEIYDNPAATTNEAEAPSIVSLLDYGVGAIYGELSGYAKKYAAGQENLKEGLKAFVVASYSYMLGQESYGRAGFDLKTTELYYPTGNCRLICCNPNTNSHYKHYNGDKYGTCMATTSSQANHPALSEYQLTRLRELVSEVFGEVMVKKGVTADTFSGSDDIKFGSYYNSVNNSDYHKNSLGQQEAIQDSINGMTYKEILAKYYDSNEYDIINIKEGLYVNEESYGDGEYSGDVIFYDQSDYKNVKFCGRSKASISSSGCGVTAMAIILSSLTGNKTYDPVYTMNLAYSYGDCGSGINGTNSSFFRKAADKFGFKYKKTDSGSEVIEALKSGKSMVIAHMGSGHFTSGGHYMVLSATNSSGQVYVHDPNNKGNKNKRNTGNGWYDLNLIVSESKGDFHIITKE